MTLCVYHVPTHTSLYLCLRLVYRGWVRTAGMTVYRITLHIKYNFKNHFINSLLPDIKRNLELQKFKIS